MPDNFRPSTAHWRINQILWVFRLTARWAAAVPNPRIKIAHAVLFDYRPPIRKFSLFLACFWPVFLFHRAQNPL